MEDTRLKLLVALILRYKKSTHAKEKEKPSTKEKNQRHNKKTEFQREIEEWLRINRRNKLFFIFSCFLFHYGDVFDG